jgi:hypothetical protein
MKMDATLKRRIWKVAIVHFGLTLFVLWELLHFASYFGPSEQFNIFEIWGNLWVKMFFLLQPQCLVGLLKMEVPETVERIIFCCLVLYIPIWSYCFGWLFVKFDNWLNHFPILGKRVF